MFGGRGKRETGISSSAARVPVTGTAGLRSGKEEYMKVAVSSTGKDLDSQIDPRFGRCAYFLIVETDDLSFEAFDNESIALGGGAGIQSAQFVASKGVKAVLTGNCGPNAVRTLSAAGIELFVGQNGTAREAVERFKKGEIYPATEANVTDHYGMGGGGRGMGMGGGRGMARGSGISMRGDSSPPPRRASSREEELQRLKDQTLDLKRQMEEIQARIDHLEKGQE